MRIGEVRLASGRFDECHPGWIPRCSVNFRMVEFDQAKLAFAFTGLQDPSSNPSLFGGADQAFVQQLLQNLELSQTALRIRFARR